MLVLVYPVYPKIVKKFIILKNKMKLRTPLVSLLLGEVSQGEEHLNRENLMPFFPIGNREK